MAEGAGREGIPDDDQGSQSEDESQSASKGVSPSDGSSRGDGIKGSDAVDLSGSLRHVWFDFHHEVRLLDGVNRGSLTSARPFATQPCPVDIAIQSFFALESGRGVHINMISAGHGRCYRISMQWGVVLLDFS